MSRERLSSRRPAIQVAITWQPAPGRECVIDAGFGFYDDGRPAEVFAIARKSELDTLIADAAVLISLLLQYGCPAKKIADLVGRQDAFDQVETGTKLPDRPMSPIGAIADQLDQLSEAAVYGRAHAEKVLSAQLFSACAMPAQLAAMHEARRPAEEAAEDD